MQEQQKQQQRCKGAGYVLQTAWAVLAISRAETLFCMIYAGIRVNTRPGETPVAEQSSAAVFTICHAHPHLQDDWAILSLLLSKLFSTFVSPCSLSGFQLREFHGALLGRVRAVKLYKVAVACR
jgi:hypothetical protein